MSGTNFFLFSFILCVKFVDPQPPVRFGWYHVRSLPGALLDLLWCHAHREGGHQDAHSEDVRDHRLQRVSTDECPGPAGRGAGTRTHAAEAVQEIPTLSTYKTQEKARHTWG